MIKGQGVVRRPDKDGFFKPTAITCRTGRRARGSCCCRGSAGSHTAMQLIDFTHLQLTSQQAICITRACIHPHTTHITHTHCVHTHSTHTACTHVCAHTHVHTFKLAFNGTCTRALVLASPFSCPAPLRPGSMTRYSSCPLAVKTSSLKFSSPLSSKEFRNTLALCGNCTTLQK